MSKLLSNFRANTRSLWARTVWAEGAIPIEEIKYRSLRTFIYPIYDVAVMLSGALGAIFGVPAIEEFYPNWVTNHMGAALMFMGLLALIGVAFPHLWKLEAFAKSAIIGMMLGYITALIMLTAEGNAGRGFVIAMAVGFILLPVSRLILLRELRREEDAGD